MSCLCFFVKCFFFLFVGWDGTYLCRKGESLFFTYKIHKLMLFNLLLFDTFLNSQFLYRKKDATNFIYLEMSFIKNGPALPYAFQINLLCAYKFIVSFTVEFRFQLLYSVQICCGLIFDLVLHAYTYLHIIFTRILLVIVQS